MTALASENSNRPPLSPDTDSVCCMNKLNLETGFPDCVNNNNDSHVTNKQNTTTTTTTTSTRKLSNSHHTDTQSDTSTNSVSENGLNGGDVTQEDLSDRIRRQIEYYFSKENYRSDQYLLSQSDGDQYVSISTLATFPAVKNLSPDLEFIKQALRGSEQLELDPSENKVRPNLKRCILILRDIPEDTPLEEIEALFDGEGLPDVRGRIEFAINNNCYVRFDSETEAHAAFHSVINRTFNGRPIYPRLKSASSSLQSPPEIPNQFTSRPYDQYPMYNYQAFPSPYMHPAPVPSWSPMDPIMYHSYLKPFLVPRLIPIQRIFPHKQSEFILSPVTRNGGMEFNQTSPSSSRHHSSSDTHGRDQQTGGDSHGEGRSSRRKTGGRYPSREEKKSERIPTPKMDTDSFPPLPSSPGVHPSHWSAPSTPQTTAEPTNKTLSDIVRKGQSPQPRHSAAHPPPSLGRGRGRPAVRSPVPEVGEGDSEFIQRSEVRPLGRGRRPKAQSTSDTSNQSNQLTEPSRSQSESGEKDILKSEKLSYAQMAQKVPPPPPPPLPEAANYLPPSPPLSSSPGTPSQSNTFFKDSSDTFFNGSSKTFQDNDSKQRKHLVRVSNGPMNRGVRGYNGSDSSKPHRKGGYSSNSRNSRDRRSVHQDRDNSIRDH